MDKLADGVGQIIVAVIAGAILLALPTLFKKYSEKISKNWLLLVIIILSGYLLYRLYILSGGDIFITLNGVTFLCVIYLATQYTQNIYFSLNNARNEFLEKTIKESNEKLINKLNIQIKELNERFNRLEMQRTLDEAIMWQAKNVEANVITTCAEILQKDVNTDSIEFENALEIIQETLEKLIAESGKLDTYSLSELQKGLKRTDTSKILVKKILKLLDKL
jgi:hypothetical protein